MLNGTMSFYDDLINGVRESIEADFDGKPSRMARQADTHPSTLSRLVEGERNKWLNLISRIADTAGLKVVKSGLPGARDVCFVDAKVVTAGTGQRPPDSEDYMAVPLVDEVGAGPGLIPQGELLSWFLVYRHQDAVRYRSDLIAVQISKHSTSMEPILHPGDIVLIDRSPTARDTRLAGRMMLVLDPDGQGKIKRVAVEQRKGGDYRITYYSDNAANNPPEIYSLREDFLNSWERAIVGRVVWAWSDVSNK